MRPVALVPLAALLLGCRERIAPPVLGGTARSADSVEIRYDARGSGSPVIMLIPGWTNPRQIWGEHAETLARDHRVIAIDLAGHGESGTNRTTWSVKSFAEDVVAVADREQVDRVVLAGFSMGGAVALEAARLLGERAAGIVFVDTFQDPDLVMPSEQVEGVIAQFRAAWGDTAFLRAFAYTPETPDSILRWMASFMPAELGEHQFDIFREQQRWTVEGREEALRGVAVPVAAINSTREPTRVEALRRYFPGFTVDTIDGVGHAGILHERVARFDSLMLALVDRFIER